MNTNSTFQDRFDHSQYISITMEFRCNLACEHCMIEGTMDRLAPQTKDQFERLLASNKAHKHWRGLILTGSEITLIKDLASYARRAKASGFEHIRIQTHGMHLAQASFCDELIDAGIDEFFVSVAAADAHTHDRITTVEGSFERTLQGLENLERYDHVISITNTVLTQRSYQQLPLLAQQLGLLKHLVQMEYWNYWPMQGTDTKQLMVKHSDLLPYLREAIAITESYGKTVEVKNFPVCLLEEYGDRVINAQPQLIIDDDFWPEFARNGFYQCPHQATCLAKDCLGINVAYQKQFGSEHAQLRPLTLKQPS